MKTNSPNLNYHQLSELSCIVDKLEAAEQELVDFGEENQNNDAFLISDRISEIINLINAL